MNNLNSNKPNINHLRIDSFNGININMEMNNINYLTKNYWNSNFNNNINNNIFTKNSPKIVPDKINTFTSKKIGCTGTNNNKFFSKIN